jgi:alcohol dehydrogenase (quinone), cytochrome c subunit
MKRSASAVKLRRLLPSALLMTLGACSQPSAPTAASDGAPAPAGPADRGTVLYMQNCVACHREKGEGVPNVYPSLAGSAAVMGDPIELAQWVLSQKRPATIPAGRYPTQMLLFGWMKDDDAAALLTYIRSNFGNSAPPVDAATIAQARAK